MTFPESVFRAYDIRGIIDKEITPEFMTSLGRALATTQKATKAVVGYDARPSSVEFTPHLVEGLLAQGCDVINLGMVPSEVVIATAALNNISLACIVTASHNPSEYVGVKMFRDSSVPILTDNGLTEVKELMRLQRWGNSKEKGKSVDYDPWPSYTKLIQDITGQSPFKKRKILVDAGNGVGGILIEHLAPIFNLDVTPMFFEPDGTYPNHIPNPILPESRTDAIKKAKEEQYDFTLLFDGDADRIMFLDETGEYITSDAAGTLLASEIIEKKYPSSPIVIDPRRGWTTQDNSKENNYPYVLAMAGSPFIKKAMREHNAPFGYEASAHNFYRDYFFSDSAGVTLGYILELLETSGKKLSELVKPYQENHFMIDETNYVHPDYPKIFSALETKFSDAKITKFDGLSVDYQGWHANVRASNTEPVIRLNLEGRNQAIVDKMFTEIDKLIRDNGGTDADPHVKYSK